MEDSNELEKKRNHYLAEISRRSPPTTSSDEFMLEVYQALLDNLGSCENSNEEALD